MLKPLSWYKTLHDPKSRREENAFLVEGLRAITQITLVSPASIIELVVSENDTPPENIHCPVRTVTASQFRSVCASTNPSGPLAVVTIPKGVYSSALPETTGNRVLVLEDMQDPGNVGALIRSAAAFDFDGVVLSEKCADPFGPKAVQASAGSVLSVWLRRTKDYREMISALAREGYYCIAADVDGTEPLQAVNADKMMLIVRNEGSGISKETLACAQRVVNIPMNGKKVESLNAAVSGGLCMYVLSSRRA
jgi:RNA methyltransferase, TrmH family